MKDLLLKYINKECSKEELEKVITYFKTSDSFTEIPSVEELKEIFKKYPDMNEFVADKIYNEVLKLSKTKKSKSYKVIKLISATVAAAAVVVISIVFGVEKNNTKQEIESSITYNKVVLPGKSKAILTLEDGKELCIEKGKTFNRNNVTTNGEKIIYSLNKSTNKLKKQFNYLTIPRGGEFYLELSDGTKVWLNSDTQIKYPVKFIEGETRVVELLYGEAYFDVSPSIKHNGDTFQVISPNQQINVVGTEFNIKSYKNDSSVYTTLVEGKVNVALKNNITKKLIPNERMTLNKNKQSIVVNTVDVYNEISWKEGVFSFEEKPFKEIVKVLSRWYDIEFDIKTNLKKDNTFFGVLRRDQNLEEILLSFKKLGVINDFKVLNKKVIIN